MLASPFLGNPVYEFPERLYGLGEIAEAALLLHPVSSLSDQRAEGVLCRRVDVQTTRLRSRRDVFGEKVPQLRIRWL